MSTGQQFGEVADVYDDVRPGYTAEITDVIRGYLGGPPARVAEIGAGTGKCTEFLRPLGGVLTCVEPDPRMAALLRGRFPDVEVVIAPFEGWTPPAGVDLLACAMAWHWLDEGARNRLAHAALRPGGTLAVVGGRYGYADPGQSAAIGAAFATVEREDQDQKPAVVRHDAWIRDDVAASGLFQDVELVALRRQVPMPAGRYLRLVQTFGPFRAGSPQRQATILRVLGETLDRLGGGVVLDLHTSVTLARRAA